MKTKIAYLGLIAIRGTTPLAIKWSTEGSGYLFGIAGRMLLTWWWVDGAMPLEIPARALFSIVYLGVIASAIGFALIPPWLRPRLNR